MSDWTFADLRGDFIPAIPTGPTIEHPDTFDIRQAPVSLNAPDGKPTCNFDKATGTIICKFNRHSVNPDLIQRAVRYFRQEYGMSTVRFIDVFVSDETMAGPDGVWLVSVGFERQPDANAKSGLYRWRKAVRVPKTKEEKN